MNTRDRVLADGACTALLVAAKRRGLLGLEQCWARFTPRQRQLVPPQFLHELRAEFSERSEKAETARAGTAAVVGRGVLMSRSALDDPLEREYQV